ncbi:MULTISPECIES: DUF2919 domain-containing protein [Vibrio]|uniref:DUF2919 domain-containing protein n=1 Tax=Vibrio TaxID=662 RepID=UPI003D0ADF56
MRYAFEQYDKHGFLKAPIWLWLGWFFLVRAWVVFVVAGASRNEGVTILEYVYPDQKMLYIGLAMGLPIAIAMWLISLRKPESTYINGLVNYLKPISLIVVAGQLIHTTYLVNLQHWGFSWTNAVTLVLLLWFAIYLVNSRTVVDCLATPNDIRSVTDHNHNSTH